MKTVIIFFWLLLLCALSVHAAAPDDQSDFLQSEVKGSIFAPSEADKKLPLSERINLLFIASYYSATNAIAPLIGDDLSANSTNSSGMTALMWVARGTRYQREASMGAVKYLINLGANPKVINKHGKSAADYAFEYGRYDLLSALDWSGKYKSFYEGEKYSKIQDQFEQSVWDLVVESWSHCGNLTPESYSKIKVVSDALKAGVNPDQDILLMALGGASSEDYWIPLGQIMPEAISELVKGGARVDEPLSNGLQPLFYTVSKPKLFKMLLNAGADPHKASHVPWMDWSAAFQNPKLKFGSALKLKFITEPIICEAAELGIAETLQMLLARGVSIEERDSQGNTPLHRAIAFANADAIDFLLQHHASLQATNNAGQNALDMAATTRNVNFIRTHDKTGSYHQIIEDFPGDPKSPAVGKWALESARTNLLLQLDPQGGGTVFRYWKKPIAWKVVDNGIEIPDYIPDIPRKPGGFGDPGRLEYHAETDTCVLKWPDGPLKLVRMK